MERKRQKYFREVISKSSESDVKCKKKQAVDKLKNKPSPNKENVSDSSENIAQTYAQMVTVAVADIHNTHDDQQMTRTMLQLDFTSPDGKLKAKSRKKESPLETLTMLQLDFTSPDGKLKASQKGVEKETEEIKIVFEDRHDKNIVDTKPGSNSSDDTIISDSDDNAMRLPYNLSKSLISQRKVDYQKKRDDGSISPERGAQHLLANVNNQASRITDIRRAPYQEQFDDQKKDDNHRNVINFEEPKISDDQTPSTYTSHNQVLPDADSAKSIDYQTKTPSREQSEELQPTFTDIIPEETMEIIRKSLEEGENNDSTILTIPDIDSNKQEKQKKRRNTIKKTYIDFLSEDEDFEWDSTSWKDTDKESSSSGEEPKRKKSKKCKGSVDGKVGEEGLKKKKINKRLKEKEARQKGKRYTKKNGTIVNEKILHPNPCIGKKCGHNCQEVTEERRKTLFDYFWSLTPAKRKDWLIALSNKKEAKRKRVKDSGYRANTFEYFINDGEGRRQVCLKFMLKTLDLSHKYVYYTLSQAVHGLAKDDQRGKTIPANKTTEATRESVIRFIKNLPALPSHYCRKDITRLYLPVELKSIKNLYRIYKEDQTSQSLDIVSENIFRDIFKKEFNLGFHVPKKDKCLKCMRYETDLLKYEAEKKEHLDEKVASKNRYACHRDLGKENPSILCTSFDLQKVLNTPYGNSILLFYTRKYAVYNLCFYENVTRQGYCFIWGEADAKRGGNEVGTVLEKYIETVDSRGSVKHLILYSDSCSGQNKNKIVLTAVHIALAKAQNLESIQLNYLLPGHTEMSVDSMHSVIENSIRNTTVWAPSQWLTICQIARKDVSPYNVQWLDHKEFKNFEEVSNKYFKGNLTGKMSKIRIATLKKNSLQNLSVKYSMKEDTKEETISIIGKPKMVISKLYKSLLPISKAKYNDLKKLCETDVIPKIFHREYLAIPTTGGIIDTLIDTDVEDISEVEC